MLLIDAYNVLHARGVLPGELADLGVAGLIRLIASSRYGRRELTLVCDGGGSGGQSGARLGHARVLFSGTNAEADDLIERLIVSAGRGASLAVVSSDKRLRRAARRARAESIESDRFLAHLVADRDAPPRQRLPAFVREVPLDRYSVAHWMREFGLHPEIEPPPDPRPEPAPPPSPAPPREPDRRRRPRSGPPAEGAPAASPEHTRFGERLGLSLSERTRPDASDPPGAAQPARPSAQPPATTNPGTGTETTPGPPSERDDAGPRGLDPLIRQALEEWRGRLSADDLDTGRWIDGVTPLRPDRTGRDRG